MIIEEKYSRYWIQITVTLAGTTLLFLIGYSLVSNLYWQGLLRVAAFGLLAATVFSALKVMQGKHTVEISTEDGNLILTYRKKDREVSRDVFALSKIRELEYERHTEFLGITFFSNDLNLRFLPADADRFLNLIEVNGRALALTEEDARKVADFVRSNAKKATIQEDPA